MSYGYNSVTAFSKAVTDISDEAVMLLDRLAGERRSAEEKSRPLIFVSQSLDGILLKKAVFEPQGFEDRLLIYSKGFDSHPRMIELLRKLAQKCTRSLFGSTS